MVELSVEDVLARVAADVEQRLQVPVDPAKLAWPGRVVVLKEKHGTRELPIWIGGFEGDLIAIRLRGALPFRPMPYDLMQELIRVVGARVERVVITDWRGSTCYAMLSLEVNGRTQDVDARPSDALALAVRTETPIVANERVLHEQGVPSDTLLARLDAATPPGEWRSLRRA